MNKLAMDVLWPVKTTNYTLYADLLTQRCEWVSSLFRWILFCFLEFLRDPKQNITYLVAYEIQSGRKRIENKLKEKQQQQQLYDTQMHTSERFSPTVIQNSEEINHFIGLHLSTHIVERERQTRSIRICNRKRAAEWKSMNLRYANVCLTQPHAHSSIML